MNYRNARYIDAVRIDCEIEHPVYGWVPYTLDPTDTDKTIDNDVLLALMTSVGDVAPYTPPSAEEMYTQEAIATRDKRGTLLAASDWTQVADAPVDQVAWAAYRQALRDVPAQEGFPTNVVWPVAP